MKFSERYGYTMKKPFSLENIDQELKIGLYNKISLHFLDKIKPPIVHRNIASNLYFKQFKIVVWGEFLHQILDDFFYLTARKSLKDEYISNFRWYEILNFLEVIANLLYKHSSYKHSQYKIDFIKECNIVFERENSGYRFVGEIISPITSKLEIDEIERAMTQENQFKPVEVHLNQALIHLSEKENPDYRNSIKESISAVESMCNIITGKKSSTLTNALKKINEYFPLHAKLRKAFGNLYSYTSGASGIRHGLMDVKDEDLRFEDAKYMLVSCSAFVNYLKEKYSRLETTKS